MDGSRLAALAAKGSLCSPITYRSHLVIVAKFVIHLTLAMFTHPQFYHLSLNETGHTWSHLVTTGHKLFLSQRWSHWQHSIPQQLH